MNILLAASSHDGASWIAFNLKSLNLELEHHKNLYDAIQLCLKIQEGGKRFGEGSGQFGDIISVSYGEILEDRYFIESMLRANAELGDEESEYYDPRYTDITIEPPFQIDAVIHLRTFA